jgi:hypothetical protein
MITKNKKLFLIISFLVYACLISANFTVSCYAKCDAFYRIVCRGLVVNSKARQLLARLCCC